MRASLFIIAVCVTSCGVFGGKTGRERVAERGQIKAEWTVRDDGQGRTYRFFVVSERGALVTYEVLSVDGYRSQRLETVGGIEPAARRCYLYGRGIGNVYEQQGERVVARGARTTTNQRTHTDCSEYRDTPAWALVSGR